MITRFNTILFLLFINIITLRASNNDTVNLLFIGDIMQHMPQINSAYDNGVYDYEPCFRYIKPEAEKANVTIANLEVPLAGKPYSGYPQFSAPNEIAFALKDAGFDILATANNHSCDKLAKGIKGTISTLDSAKFLHTGVFLNKDDRDKRHPLFFESNNIRFAMLNYTYGTNGIPAPQPYIVNLIDTAQILKDIQTAKNSSPDIIIAFMHWGDEYMRLPNKAQKDLADLLINNGVKLVIGAHPHVMQPMIKHYDNEGRTKAAVVYSLGNFVSNQSQPNTDGGAMARIRLIKDPTGVRIQNCAYSLVWVYKPIVDNKKKYYIIPAANHENVVDYISPTDEDKLKTFLKNSRELLNLHNVGFTEYKF